MNPTTPTAFCECVSGKACGSPSAHRATTTVRCLSFGLSAQLHPQIQTDAGVGILSASPAPSRQTTLWIVKILSRRNGEDEISFRIYEEDDALDYAEPATWHVQTHGLHHDARLDLVVLTSEGLAPRVIDEFRLGPTWRSVVPIQVLLSSR